MLFPLCSLLFASAPVTAVRTCTTTSLEVAASQHWVSPKNHRYVVVLVGRSVAVAGPPSSPVEKLSNGRKSGRSDVFCWSSTSVLAYDKPSTPARPPVIVTFSPAVTTFLLRVIDSCS